MIDHPKTVTDLASVLDVNRRRIAKWRTEEQAPASLDLAEWRRWLHDSGRTKIAERIDAATSPLEGPALETAAAAVAELQPPNDDGKSPEVPMPEGELECPSCKHKYRSPAGASHAAWKNYWDARDKRQSAITREKNDRVNDRDLIPADEVKALLSAMASAQLEALGDSIWLALRPNLDGVPDSLRKTLRAAHDASTLAMRGRLAAILRDKFTAITNPPAKLA
ncbi:MAG TPA: hypothetical protein VHX44_09480 [Planctomycetota bacterium]|nr:hypothetical protein [Planctomycetota bacterium]